MLVILEKRLEWMWILYRRCLFSNLAVASLNLQPFAAFFLCLRISKMRFKKTTCDQNSLIWFFYGSKWVPKVPEMKQNYASVCGTFKIFQKTGLPSTPSNSSKTKPCLISYTQNQIKASNNLQLLSSFPVLSSLTQLVS